MKLVTAEEMRAVEREAERRGITVEELIARAGAALAASIRRAAPSGPVLILVGPGNNGSDGLVAARLLETEGRDVTVYSFRRSDFEPFDGSIEREDQDPDRSALRRRLDEAAVVVDALLGTGQSRPPEGALADIVSRASHASGAAAPRIAVDVPTGVNADTGIVPGAAFCADETLCMGAAKRGVALYPGAQYAGHVEVAPVGIPDELYDAVRTTWLSASEVGRLLPRRSAAGNKGSSGRVLFIGGSIDFVGAPVLASVGAYRAGAGLVEVAVPGSIQLAVASHAVEPVYVRLPERNGQITRDARSAVAERLEKADAVILGPGMGLSDTTIETVRELLPVLRGARIRGAVIDADGLNALAILDSWWESAPDSLVLTPHPGEMARLTGSTVADVQQDRVGVATEFARKWGAIVVLKGAGTVIAAPDGRAAINPTGGPNLATGGTGDVLSGIIGSLIAQGLTIWDAAISGVFLHGRAGDLVAARLGDAGTLAGDLLGAIPEARLALLAEAEVQHAGS